MYLFAVHMGYQCTVTVDDDDNYYIDVCPGPHPMNYALLLTSKTDSSRSGSGGPELAQGAGLFTHSAPVHHWALTWRVALVTGGAPQAT